MGALDRVFRGRRPAQQRPDAAIVAGLWRNGEQGVWYDPSDLSTMFQDASGTTPVYMPGQGQPDCWIGLQLDKRRRLTRGPEMLSNGDFSGGAAGWDVAGADATHVVDFTGGACRYKSDTTSPVLIVSQGSLSIVAGRWYELTIVVSSWVSGSVKTDSFIGAAPSGLVLASSAGTFRVIGLATSTTSKFSFLRNAANTDLTIDSISIRELPGNHRWQGTATSRPVLSARYNLVTKSESVSNAAWVKFTGGTATPPSVTENYSVSPRGDITADRVVLSRGAGVSANDYALVSIGTGAMGAATRTIRSVWLKSNTGLNQEVALYDGVQVVGGPVTVFPAWRQFFITGGTAGASSSLAIGTRGGASYFSNTQLDLDICVWGADIRVEGDGVGLPSYQRVDDANTYDTVGFPLYRKPDGVDDWMQTANVDFSGTTKITVATAMRKMSDAARAVAIELGQFAENTAGNFALEYPSAGLGNVMARASGASSVNIVQAAPLPAPASAVLQARLDSTVGVALRVNGGAWPENKIAFGGAFVNSPIYFDRRGGTTLPSGARDYGTIIVGSLLSPPETAAVEKYLRQKSRAY